MLLTLFLKLLYLKKRYHLVFTLSIKRFVIFRNHDISKVIPFEYNSTFKLGYQVIMKAPIKSPQRLPVRKIENQRKSDFLIARVTGQGSV